MLEANRRYLNLSAPRASRSWAGAACTAPSAAAATPRTRQMAMLWVLNLSDGDHTLLDVAERAGLPFALVAEVAAGTWRRPACSPQEA